MALNRKINVALVGLSFGAEFIPIYLHHPNVGSLTICDLDEDLLNGLGDKYGVSHQTSSLEKILEMKDIDAVHLVTPPTVHAKHSVAVLNADKHCACTIPMGLTIEELRAIIAAQRQSGKNYMMMETAVYTREFLYVKDLLEKGELGTITFARGAHLQDMEGWPSYWTGFPPLVHITHAFAPVLALLKTRAVKVHCFGSGELREDLRGGYGNPYPFETAIFRLENTNVAAECSRFMFQVARSYTESFGIYGERMSFEWQQVEEELPVIFRMLGKVGDTRGGIFGLDEAEIAGLSPVLRDRLSKLSLIAADRIEVPDRQDLLPEEIARFTQRGVYDENNPSLSFKQGGMHGGSHPHLVHEFVRSIIEERKSVIDEITAANWTAAGICAHESAMKDGELVVVPSFD